MTKPRPGLDGTDHEAAEQPESDVIRRAQDGDEDASLELVKRYYDKVYRLAYRFLANAEDAKDIAQETFLRAFAAVDRFHLNLSFSPWISKIAMNLVTDTIRARYRKRTTSLDDAEVAASGPDPSDASTLDEQGSIVRSLVDGLPPKYRTVLALRDMEGYGMEEIAAMLGCPRATVRWRLHQARKLFKKRWERTQSS